ncbi:unnamed protein product [Nippostrongylus brasiliensis]|uniref:Ig-like domain-containing protein n=1 Tax=Nippostrongylus brasiliensis TaxID=27835 RepID=A0A0N4YP19_NIPBR|nr:unnamed protein product [Nippostrongylus brasiliensis]
MMRHRRYKRAKSLEKYVALPPSYELVLSHDEPPHLDSTLAVTVEEGQTLRLKCTAGEGIDEQTLKFERELEEIKGKRSPRRCHFYFYKKVSLLLHNNYQKLYQKSTISSISCSSSGKHL